jgi:hypothetical protein
MVTTGVMSSFHRRTVYERPTGTREITVAQDGVCYVIPRQRATAMAFRVVGV